MTAVATISKKRRFGSKAFIVTLTTLGVLLTLACTSFALNAAHRHAAVADRGNEQTFLVEKALAAGKAPVDAGVEGTQYDSDNNVIRTSLRQLPHKDFLLRLTANDGYAYQYDSRTGFHGSGCGFNPTCWLGVKTSASA